MDMQTLLSTCRPASFVQLTLGEDELQDKVDGLFRWFAQDVPAMKAVMRGTRAFIGGSLALTLFCPIRFKPSNADIFVPDAEVEGLLIHLTTREGFEIAKTTVVDRGIVLPTDPTLDEDITDYGAGVVAVRRLRRGALWVNVLTFRDTSPSAVNPNVLTLAWTTLLMNYVTPDYACCAYPSLTFLGRGLYHMDRWMDRSFPGDNSNHLLNTYADRGFELSRHPSGWFEGTEDTCEGGWMCPFEPRRFGDGGCLTIPAVGGPVACTGRTWIFGGIGRTIHDL